MINVPLLKWEFRRYLVLYIIFLAVAVGSVALLLPQLHGTFDWNSHPYLNVGMFVSIFFGMGMFPREFMRGNTVEFLLARPSCIMQGFRTSFGVAGWRGNHPHVSGSGCIGRGMCLNRNWYVCHVKYLF
ncbi:MAG: hypothetical protein ACOY31_06040 [Bacillota bacterium]